MKGLVLLLIAACFTTTFAQTLNQEQLVKLKAYYEKCTKDTGVDVKLIMKGRQGQFTEDDKLAQYYFCMFNQIGIVNDDGELQPEVAIAKKPADISKEDVEKVIAACKDQKGADKYKTAQKLYECYYKANSKHIDVSAALGQ